MAVKELNKNNFDDTIQNNLLVFVDFWAAWCEPCKLFAPIYAEIADQYPEIIFANINIGQEPELAKDFNIRSIPHLIILKQSIAIYSSPGLISAKDLKDLVIKAKECDLTALQQQIAMDKQKNNEI